MSTTTTTLDWYGCATFRLTIGELVVFLDAYIDRVPDAPGTGLTADDIDRADWIVIGHSHFDHIWGAERIALNTGATVIGSYETCRVLARAGVPHEQLMPVAGGERVRLSDDVVVGVFPSLHSCVWSQTSMTGADDVCLGDLGLTHQEREARMGDLAAHFVSLGDDVLEPPHGFEPTREGRRRRARLRVRDARRHRSSTRTRPGTGAASCTTSDPTSRSSLPRDGATSTASRSRERSPSSSRGRHGCLKARRVILCHHDDWLPGFSTATDTGPIREELARWLPGAELTELDYLDGHQVFPEVVAASSD